MYCAFQQFFTDNCELDGGFDSVFGKSLSTMPGMKHHFPYYNNSELCLEILQDLTDSLSEADRPLITDVECTWENRIHNAGLLGFYLGYRAAFDLWMRCVLFPEWNVSARSCPWSSHSGLSSP